MYKRLKYNFLGGLVIQNRKIEEKITSKVLTLSVVNLVNYIILIVKITLKVNKGSLTIFSTYQSSHPAHNNILLLEINYILNIHLYKYMEEIAL